MPKRPDCSTRVSRFALALTVSIGGAGCDRQVRKEAPTALEQAKAMVEATRREVENEVSAPEGETGLYVPNGEETMLPLLVFLHGLGGSGRGLAESLGLRREANRRRFAFLAPEGATDYSGRQFWNASGSCCNFDGLEVDHVASLKGQIAEAAGHPRVDPRRVYVVGYSNGGFMAYRLACDSADSIRGVVSIAGAALSVPERCQPSRPVSVVQIHGDRDPIVAYSGGLLFADTRRPPHPSAESSVRWWAERNQCQPEPRAQGMLDVDPRIGGAETEVVSFEGCQAARVELWTVRGGDHSSGLSRRSLAGIWDFIQRDAQPLPSGDAP